MRIPHLFVTTLFAFCATNALAFGDASPDTVKSTPVAPLKLKSEETTMPGKLSPTAVSFAKELYAGGETKQLVGRVMSWGGLAATVIGSAANQSQLSGIGGLVMLVGIPVNGSGASDMVEAANQLNPEVKIEMNGWGTYGASWGLMGGGIAVLLAGVGNNSVPMAATGAIAFLAGDIMQYVAWYQFSASADRAQLSHKNSPYAMAVSPAVYASRDGALVPGMNLALRF